MKLNNLLFMLAFFAPWHRWVSKDWKTLCAIHMTLTHFINIVKGEVVLFNKVNTISVGHSMLLIWCESLNIKNGQHTLILPLMYYL